MAIEVQKIPLKKVRVVTPYGLRGRAEPVIENNILITFGQNQEIDVFEIEEGSTHTWGRVTYSIMSTGDNGIRTDFCWIALGHPFTSDKLAQPPEPFRWAAWPTEFVFLHGTHKMAITQFFGVNKQNYQQFDLDGHEGLDLRAPKGSKIFTIADGVVVRTGDDRKKRAEGGHNYGVRVYIGHADGYQTVYAHLDSRLVDIGDKVAAGQQIGTADDTGNSYGSHLHLTMKKYPNGQEGWPYNIIDPTPFMIDYLRG